MWKYQNAGLLIGHIVRTATEASFSYFICGGEALSSLHLPVDLLFPGYLHYVDFCCVQKKKKKVIWWSLLGRYITLHEDHGKWGIGGSRNEIQMLNFKENDTWVKETSTRKQSNSDMEEIDNSLEHESSTLKS